MSAIIQKGRFINAPAAENRRFLSSVEKEME
jgi:hypothetical protein